MTISRLGVSHFFCSCNHHTVIIITDGLISPPWQGKVLKATSSVWRKWNKYPYPALLISLHTNFYNGMLETSTEEWLWWRDNQNDHDAQMHTMRYSTGYLPKIFVWRSGLRPLGETWGSNRGHIHFSSFFHRLSFCFTVLTHHRWPNNHSRSESWKQKDLTQLIPF